MTTSYGTVEVQDIVFPEHANHYGTLFAGHGLQFMAKVAFLAGRSVAQRDIVVAGVNGVEFLAPVPVGHVLTLRASVTRLGRASMTVNVLGLAENLGAPQKEVLKGVFEMVAVDAAGRPAAIERTHLNQEIA